MKKYLNYVIPAVAAYIATVSFSILQKIDADTSFYMGTDIPGWNLSSVAVLAIAFWLVRRFIKAEVIKNRGRIVLSATIGLMISLSGVWGKLMLYNTYSIFDTPGHVAIAWLLPVGLSIVFIPLVSEIVGLVDGLAGKNVYEAACEKRSKLSAYFDSHSAVFFLAVWGIIFITYLPLFLYCWPGNFIYDAGDEIASYLVEGRLSTHHPMLHVLMLGETYSLGQKMGNPSAGLQFYTLFQMLILSASFAYMLLTVRKRKPVKTVYYAILAVTILNPLNMFFAVSAVKGVIGAALFVFAICLLLNNIEDDKLRIGSLVGFVLLTILSCHFRNNMIYAVLAGGIVISLLQKGMKKKLIIILSILLVFAGYKLSYAGLKAAMGAADATPVRESLSVPLESMVRIAINHKEELPASYYEEICNYIPEEYHNQYSPFISDNIKANAIEDAIKPNLVNFMKLYAKLWIKYPGDCVESIVGLTIGYWYPFDYPYWISGSNSLGRTPIGFGLEQIEVRHIFPAKSSFYEWYFDSGRMEMPLVGWFWRGTIYTWSFFFAFGYCIYSKNKKGISLIMIPLFYLLSCFWGPVSFIRYIYINVALMPMLLYAMTDRRESN